MHLLEMSAHNQLFSVSMTVPPSVFSESMLVGPRHPANVFQSRVLLLTQPSLEQLAKRLQCLRGLGCRKVALVWSFPWEEVCFCTGYRMSEYLVGSFYPSSPCISSHGFFSPKTVCDAYPYTHGSVRFSTSSKKLLLQHIEDNTEIHSWWKDRGQLAVGRPAPNDAFTMHPLHQRLRRVGRNSESQRTRVSALKSCLLYVRRRFHAWILNNVTV